MSDDNTIELNRRRVLGGLVTVGGAAAAAGAGTFAFFSDTESSSGNSVTAGTLDLDSPSDDQFEVTNAAPGDPYSGTITTTYQGSINNVELDLQTELSEVTSEGSGPSHSSDQSASAFAQQLTVDTAELKINSNVADDLLASSDTNNSSRTRETDISATASNLDAVVTALNDVDNYFSDIQNGDTITINISGSFDSNAGNDYQNDSASVKFTFIAEQSGKD